MPTSLPFSSTKRLGAWFSTISTCSSSASSSSHGDALKYGRDRRAMTFTSVAPSRFDVRQQSIAVLPTPMISTRGSIFSMWPKCTEPSHSMPMWIDFARVAVVPARDVELLPLRRAAADEHRVVPLGEQCLEARHRRVVAHVDAHVDDVVDFLVEHGGRKPEGRNVEAHEPAGLLVLLVDHDLVAERHQVVRDRERRRAGADQRDALAVL